jgi:alcohol dehydrogenase
VIIAVDKDAGRLEAAKKLGANHTFGADEDVKAKVMELTDGRGCDVVIEAVGIPASFEMCQDLVAFGGNIANIGVHGAPAKLHIEKLWGYNIGKVPTLSNFRQEVDVFAAITMGFVNTTSTETLMKMYQAGTLDLKQLITHGMVTVLARLELSLTLLEFNLQKDGEQAYATFSAAAQHKALKMIMTTS